ncbi:MAG: hypothetical protein KDB23_22420, partial [Planctomycetales bacterium]|nr:hypothetical protein [Planctomycetales bacterium]
QLDALKASLVRASDAEAATSHLSSILRDYLQMQFEIAAPTQTTSELFNTIKHRALLSPNHRQRFQELFEATDLAKFAGLHMTLAELNADIERARELIDATAAEIMSPGSNVEAN